MAGGTTATALSPDGLDFGGSDERDTLDGTAYDDRIAGGGSDDFLSGAGGSDELSGDVGEDTLIGDAATDNGADVISGGAEGDEVAGGPGADTESGGPGNDMLGSLDFSSVGGENLVDSGPDIFSGGDDDDAIYAGPGADVAAGGPGNDFIAGGGDNDTLDGGPGNDTVLDEEGNDELTGGTGADNLDAGPGNDRVLARDGFVDVVICGPGNDEAVVDKDDEVSDTCESVDRGAETTNPDPAITVRSLHKSAKKALARSTAAKLAKGAKLKLRSDQAGKFVLELYSGKPPKASRSAARGKARLLASGKHRYRSAGNGKVKVKPTRKGKKLLRKGIRKLTLRASFTQESTKAEVVKDGKVKLKKRAKKRAAPAGSGAGAARKRDRFDPCSNVAITSAVEDLTGNTPLGYVCNPSLYQNANGTWKGNGTLVGGVRAVMTSCSGGVAQQGAMNVVQAYIEALGIVPDGPLCSTAVYSPYNMTVYKPTDTSVGAFEGIKLKLSDCSRPEITAAVIRETGAYPENGPSTQPQQGVLGGEQTSGACNPALYNHGNYSSWAGLITYVQERLNSTTTCSDSRITNAAIKLSGGWNPLPQECDAQRYKGGASMATTAEVESRLMASWQCLDPWIGQVYLLDDSSARTPYIRGYGRSGECNPLLYGNGKWISYGDLTNKIKQANGILTTAKLEIRPSGEVYDRSASALQVFPPQAVFVVNNTSGLISTGGGNLISDKGAGLIATGGLNLTGGSLIATGGLNLISDKGAGLIGQSGGNLIGQSGGNLISTGGLNAGGTPPPPQG